MAFTLGNGSEDEPVLADINVTPLVDVMLVLLIIFMIAAPMLHQGVEVALPKANAPNPRPPDRTDRARPRAWRPPPRQRPAARAAPSHAGPGRRGPPGARATEAAAQAGPPGAEAVGGGGAGAPQPKDQSYNLHSRP